MKRLYTVAILALALPAFAQTRGVPASVTSFGSNRGNTPGISASVTSLGPNGYGNRGAKYSQQEYRAPVNRYTNYYNTVCATPNLLIPSAMGCPTGVTGYAYPVNTPGSNHGRANRGRNNGRNNNGGYYPVYVPY